MAAVLKSKPDPKLVPVAQHPKVQALRGRVKELRDRRDKAAAELDALAGRRLTANYIEVTDPLAVLENTAREAQLVAQISATDKAIRSLGLESAEDAAGAELLAVTAPEWRAKLQALDAALAAVDAAAADFFRFAGEADRLSSPSRVRLPRLAVLLVQRVATEATGYRRTLRQFLDSRRKLGEAR